MLSELYKLFLECDGVSTDSRNVLINSMFFALKGDSFDGNKYAIEALNKGAKYSIIDDAKYFTHKNCILVTDVLKSLQNLANYHRKVLAIPIISITGTNGKTTSKEILTAVLSQKYKVKSTLGNLNNHIGVPLTLLSFTKELDFGIVEMGANHLNEIENLCKIAEPDYGIITNIGKAHIEGFGSFEGVIKTKNEMYDYIKKNNKIIFYNSDNELLTSLVLGYENNIKYNTNCLGEYGGEIIDANPFLSLNFCNGNKKIEIKTNLVGTYNLENIVLACTIGCYFNVELTSIKNAIESYFPKNNRSQLVEKETNKVVVDAYNANATSMKNAIENILTIQHNKKVLILGDMLELGSLSFQEHKNIFELVKNNTFFKVFFVGAEFFKFKNEVYNFFETSTQLTNFLKENKIEDSLILVKGSRGIKLEIVLDYL